MMMMFPNYKFRLVGYLVFLVLGGVCITYLDFQQGITKKSFNSQEEEGIFRKQRGGLIPSTVVATTAIRVQAEKNDDNDKVLLLLSKSAEKEEEEEKSDNDKDTTTSTITSITKILRRRWPSSSSTATTNAAVVATTVVVIPPTITTAHNDSSPSDSSSPPNNDFNSSSANATTDGLHHSSPNILLPILSHQNNSTIDSSINGSTTTIKPRPTDGIMLSMSPSSQSPSGGPTTISHTQDENMIAASPATTAKEEDTDSISLLPTDSQQLDASICLTLRGQEGIWVPWEDGYKYVTAIDERAGDAQRRFYEDEKNNGLPLPVTKWQWEDHHCPMQILTPQGFCSVLNQLGIERIFLVGDSLTFMMTLSLWKLLGNTNDPGDQFSSPFSKSFPCSYYQEEEDEETTTLGKTSMINFTLELLYSRNDHLQTQPGLTRKSNCLDRDGSCHEWIDSYSSKPNTTTLLLVNTGLHTTNFELEEASQAYQEDINNFVEAITNLNRSTVDDLVMFRTSVPGHRGCQQHDTPFTNHSEYKLHQDIIHHQYGWEKVDGFNRYVKEKWANLTNTRSSHQPSSPERSNVYNKWHLLDVYPMTVLRPDGHNPPRDCLHYNLPGPPDWWNHLLYSYLLGVANTVSNRAKPVLNTKSTSGQAPN